MIILKKLVFGIVMFGFVGVLSSQNVHAAEESINSDGNVQVNSEFEIEDDEYYYVFDSGNEVPSLARTWSQATSWSIVRGTRTYLGTETHKRGITLSATVPVGPVSVKAEATYSASGKFRKYRQYARITVRYNVYRKVDNRYVATRTAVANTSYISYVAI
ncbi:MULTISPECIES: LMxysn_1693 family intestinal colonization protein [Enterococcus]|uniref:LMxysn_1693 family intestinal colonization protein n=1 Tax=Enterococcus TaxID=1350 RepID=UPI00046C6335|nr:hypothetical protein [Enterococcus faecalis]EGO2716779.1 hypothetical protein [Enterococcus faecalis]EGO5012675.1 hypothetical protein [Enterococcus faecalis]EGO5165245.1 hypothetical protein [Enterococcus faecalis]EGO7531552.1 hypothetical protein [Enterococcus faecalis]EGO7732419.1 hypothetical protein [Enterococcus faecalis]